MVCPLTVISVKYPVTADSIDEKRLEEVLLVTLLLVAKRLVVLLLTAYRSLACSV